MGRKFCRAAFFSTRRLGVRIFDRQHPNTCKEANPRVTQRDDSAARRRRALEIQQERDDDFQLSSVGSV